MNRAVAIVRHLGIQTHVGSGEGYPKNGSNQVIPARVGPIVRIELSGQIHLSVNVDSRRNDVIGHSLQVKRVHLVAAGEEQDRRVREGAASEGLVTDDSGLEPQATQ